MSLSSKQIFAVEINIENNLNELLDNIKHILEIKFNTPAAHFAQTIASIT